MTPIRFSPTSLREGRWYEYVIRFALGGAATVFTGVISSRCGAAVGGLFLALPAIFCASATLIEKHEIRRKREVGLDGRRRGQGAAALEAAGAALGAIGMLAFAVVFWLLVESSSSLRSSAPRWPGLPSRVQPGPCGARCELCGERVEPKNLPNIFIENRRRLLVRRPARRRNGYSRERSRRRTPSAEVRPADCRPSRNADPF